MNEYTFIEHLRNVLIAISLIGCVLFTLAHLIGWVWLALDGLVLRWRDRKSVPMAPHAIARQSAVRVLRSHLYDQEAVS